MAICPAGHDSTDPRHCDHCGQLIGGPPGTPARTLPQPLPEWQCPVCHRAQTRRFCEFDGYDSQRATAPLDLPTITPVAEEPPAVTPSQWHALVTADRTYFDFVQGTGGAEVAALAFPAYYPVRRFSLRGPSMLIGRHSTQRGIDPEIDLSGRPEDPAVGRAHAQLVSQPDGCWAVVDLESTNHTYLNDFTAEPIRPNAVVALRDGDRVYLGAWTMLTVHATPLSPDGDR